MKIYKKYLIGNLIKPLLTLLIVLTITIWSTRIINYMQYVTEYNASIYIFLKMLILVLPYLMIIVLPLTIFLTTILVYSKLIENHELVILKNCGIKKIELLSPIIILSIIITIISYSITLYFSHKADTKMRKTRAELTNNLSFSIIKEGTFNNFKNLTIYANKKNKTEVENIIIYSKSKENGEKNELIQAKKAIIDGKMINLYNGNFQKFNNEEPQDIEILFFKEYKFDLSSLFKNKEISLSKRYNNIPTMELFNMFANPKTNNVLGRNEVISELNYRLFFPLISIILSLLSGSLILNFTFNRASNIKSISITSLILVLVYAIFLFLFQKSSNNIYLIYVLFAFMILITSVSIHLIKD